MVLRGRFRQYWKSWLALGLLVAVAGGFVLAAASAGHRTADAFPRFTARHGYDTIVYSGHPLPRLGQLPRVSSVTPALVTISADVGCASCHKPIDTDNFLVNEVAPGQLTRMVALRSGRMPRPSAPDEVLASFSLVRDNGLRIGSVLRPQLITPAQFHSDPKARFDPAPVMHPKLRVVGIVAAESEFPSGSAQHYDLYSSAAYGPLVNHRAALLYTYYVRLAHGDADLAGFDGSLRPLKILGTYDLDEAAEAVQSSIRPQVIGWYVLAGLAALAALAVIGQAMARQTIAERADQRALSALGVTPRQFTQLTLLRTLLTGAAGAAGAVLIAVLASPLTPVGEARLAVPAAGRPSLDAGVVLPGAAAVLAAVIAVAAGPAIRQARLLGGRPPWEPASVTVAAGRAGARAGLSAPALIGVRHALERGRDGHPVGTALLGTVMAVAALCATGVFGASLTHLIASPELYGAPYQAEFSGNGEPGGQQAVTGPLLDSLRRDRAIEQITVGAYVEVNVNGKHVLTVAMTPVRGPALLSALDGRVPRGDRDIMLGVATMHATGARVGGTVRVTVADPDGKPHTASFRVIGRASLNAGTGGLGKGAVMTTSAFTSVQCPPGARQAACRRSVGNSLSTVVLVRAAGGAAEDAALARYVSKYPDFAAEPAKPTVLVNFGESVNFPLLLALALTVFGAAALLHLLLVSVARRRAEAGLLKALGFVRRQVAAAVCWQATTVALTGIVIGVPAGIAAGRVLWRVFATNFGVVPVAVVEPVLIIALVAGVLAVANLLAAVPALLAARSDPARLLRAE